jgi:hypothetical protein
VIVKTGNETAAGTDSIVKLIVYGLKANTGEIVLDKSKCKSQNKNLFEKGQTDEFEIESTDVGKVAINCLHLNFSCI